MRFSLLPLLKQYTVLIFCLLLSSLTVQADEPQSIIVQSTTSTQNSGLFDFILPKFEKETGIKVHVVAVGTGQALKNGRNGDGDVLLVHAKAAEEDFVAKGYGVKRLDVMYNDFVIVGPADDPAGIAQIKTVHNALRAIKLKKAIFLSRGDDSGTHKKELSLWADTGIKTNDRTTKWYQETGSGMGATLNAAAGRNAYTMTDRATWLTFKNKQNLRILFQGSPPLFNQYGVIMVNPKKHANIKVKAAQTFIKWLTGDKGQQAIFEYKMDGQQLFFPNAEKKEMKKAG